MKRLSSALCCLLLIGGTSPSTRSAGKPELGASCEVSLAFVKGLVGRNRSKTLVFTSEDDGPYISGLTGLHWVSRLSGNGTAPAPPRALIRKLERQGELSSVSRCASIRTFLTSRSIAFGPAAVRRAQKLSKDFKWQAEIVGVSLAVVDDAGQSALLSSSGASAPLAASGAIHQLDHDGATNWHVTKSANLWIS